MSNSNNETKPPDSQQTKANTKAQRGNPDETYGYYFYPEREGRKDKTLWQQLTSFEGPKAANQLRCISNVYWCIQNSPMVKLLFNALKSSGCEFDPTRHASCEDCHAKVNGGFDPTINQVVICQNNSTKRDVCCSVLAHELIHMFDYCRAKVDFTNLEHLACTEIRAANIMHCSFATAWSDGLVGITDIKAKHQECVKKKALMSVMMVRKVPISEAAAVVDKVFDKCYKDTEPFGRVPRRNSRDPHRMLSEGLAFGYSGRKE